ncbi:MAG: formyltetrahydrofolate deformylase [Deltaproteobacteria bacterium]|nr:formyltetrahydrofolate deformylase [Deltaproteobacteria bacterium]
MTAKLATLLVSCTDKKGIVASLAQVLYGHGANILDADQHTDPIAGMFFQRIRFDLASLTTDRVALELGITECAARFQMAFSLSYASHVRRVAVFVSKQEHCLYDLLVRHKAGELACEVAVIVSNHEAAAPIATYFGIPFHHLPVTPETKVAQEAKIVELLERERVDLIVLARYMQVLSPELVARYPSRVINIHHSFLPAFVGASPYRQAYERGVKLIGATSHYVTAELDQGPIIEQATIPCSHKDSVEDLVRVGRDLEKRVLAAAVRWHLEDRVLVYAGKTVVFD